MPTTSDPAISTLTLQLSAIQGPAHMYRLMLRKPAYMGDADPRNCLKNERTMGIILMLSERSWSSENVMDSHRRRSFHSLVLKAWAR